MKKYLVFIILFFSAIRLFAIDGKVFQSSFISPNSGKAIPFTIYLPPRYNESVTDFPLILHLHGIGGTHNGNQITTVPESFEKALNKGLIEKAIIVFPDGFKDAFWSDSKNSDKPAESNIIHELIPYIKSNYRVNEKCISIQGFSMGGFGASKIFSKYPSLFCSFISYDGAFLNIDGMIKFHNAIWLEIFNDDTVYFKNNSPWEFFETNFETLKNKPIRILKGSLGYNVDFNKHLSGLGYAHEYKETGCDHVLKCLLDSEGELSWSSHQQGFNSTKNTKVVENLLPGYFSPNPASDYIEINLPSQAYDSKKKSNIKIYNMLGECMLTVETLHAGSHQRIEISNLTVGTYFLKLTVNQSIYSQKIIVQ